MRSGLRVARKKGGADRLLRAEAGLSYPHFLALYMVGLGGVNTQRQPELVTVAPRGIGERLEPARSDQHPPRARTS